MRQLALGVCGCAAFLAGPVNAQVTVRVSVDASGAQGTGNSGFFRSSLSADGRYVAFASDAANLVAGDTNGCRDVFVHDRLTGTTERASRDPAGVQGNADSQDPGLSADGRYVSFESLASNLVPGDTNAVADIFVRDRLTGTIERVSVDSNGVQGSLESFTPSISSDGQRVAFASSASNLIVGDTNARADVFVRDRQSGTTQRVSVSTTGTQANGASDEPAISADGRYVVFDCWAQNLIPGDVTDEDVLVRDLLNGTTEHVSVATGGAQANGTSGQPAISADGRFIAFYSIATNLAASDTNDSGDVFVRDRLAGTTVRVSVADDDAQGNGGSIFASISGDGRLVSFMSAATNLVPNDTNGARDIFVRDLALGTTERVSVSSSLGAADLDSWMDTLSLDGRCVVFTSDATNLVAGDTNAAGDVFVHDRGPASAFTPFCFGDGAGAACPCGIGAAGNGCPNSVNAGGANLSASGAASTTADTLVLAGTGMPNGGALYFQGTAQVNGGLGIAFGDGLRCAAGSITRLLAKINMAGASQYPQAGDPSVASLGLVTAPGLRTYQIWYRNAEAFCMPETFNLSNAVQVAWSP